MATPTPEMMASDWFKELWHDALKRLPAAPVSFVANSSLAWPVSVHDGYRAVELRKPDGSPLQAGDIEAGATVTFDWRTGIAEIENKGRR